jgi:putative methionine-R-sulfoxide reductase with GAF domain
MSVTTKKWRLVVTPVSGTAPLHRLEVEAPNWMGALREARKEMGEDGGLPTGASCAVAPDGTVTILDSESRRKFVLTPGNLFGSSQTHAQPAAVSGGAAATTGLVGNGQPRKRRPDTAGYEAPSPPPAAGAAAKRGELELLFTRDEEPVPDNPLTYRERAYLIPKGMNVSEAEAGLRFALAELQKQLSAVVRGKLVNLAAFDHRWTDQPLRPPLVVIEWRDWRGDPAVDYPAAEQRGGGMAARLNAEPDDRLASVFEALHELALLRTPVEALDFIVKLLETTVPSAAISACLYDINTDELRFVAATGPGSETLRGTALPVSQGLFGLAARTQQNALVIPDIAEAPSYDSHIDGRPGLRTENLLLRPVIHEGNLLGMLQLINRTSGSFSAPDVHLVNYTADRLAEFLRDARGRGRP